MPASVAKAQTLDSDKPLILCIAGGKHCDAETARQPAPASTRYPGGKSQPSGFERRSESISSMRESQR